MAWAPLLTSLLYLGLGVLRTQLLPKSTISALSSTYLWINTCFFFLSGALYFIRQEIVRLSDRNEHIRGAGSVWCLSEDRWNMNMMKSRATLFMLWVPASFGALLGSASAIIGILTVYVDMELNKLILNIIVFSYPIAFIIYGWIIHLMLNDINWLKQIQKGGAK